MGRMNIHTMWVPDAAAFAVAATSLALFIFAQPALAEDVENCLLCHKYSGLGLIDKSGKKHLYYVNEESYNSSVHGKLSCRECHDDINEFPHPNAKKVDCSKECHLVEPSTNKPFSHRQMVESYEQSVHGRYRKGELKDNLQDLPDCTYCHENRIYQPISGLDRAEQGMNQEIMDRCQGCHANSPWAKFWFNHFTHRMHQRRTSRRMVELCTKCHEDTQKMARHGLKSVSTFRDTFHWQSIKFGDPNAPNCITCHAPVGYLSHEIMSKQDPRSAIHKDNLVRTCSNPAGLQTCHPNSTRAFAQGIVHPLRFKTGMPGTKKTSADAEIDVGKPSLRNLQYLVTKWFGSDAAEKENPEYLILLIIKNFYMLLIGGLISFMICHQILDFFATRKEMKEGGGPH